MLTCLGTIGGFYLICGIGCYIVERKPIRKILDRLAHGLPMFWDWSEVQMDAAPMVENLRRKHYEKEHEYR